MMQKITLLAALAAACVSTGPARAQAPAPRAQLNALDDKRTLYYLNPAEFDVRQIYAPPPGPAIQKQELAYLHALIAATPKARIDQARADGKNETPSLYDAALGRDLSTMPATWNLLVAIETEADALADQAKDVFDRPRPYQADPSLPTCNRVKPGKSTRSYPSGHASVGFSMGWALARLVPARAPAILARADDFALSRQICGNHFPSDTTASRGVAMIVADRLLHDPRLATQVAAAKVELAGIE